MYVRVCHLAALVAIAAMSGCSFAVSRHVDGPLAGYLEEPLPRLAAPLARELSFEWVSFNTAGGYSALVVSDRTNREVKILSEKVGYRIAQLLEMDRPYSHQATLAALGLLAEHGGRSPVSSNVDRMGGGGALVAAGQAGVAATSAQYSQLRRWIESKSGAIGPGAPAGSRLTVVMLRFFDSRKFKLDSRVRVAVLMVLESAGRRSLSILEGSDVQTCINDCDLFPLKPTSERIDLRAASTDIRQEVLGIEGVKAREAEGFDGVAGIYHYVLLHHGLAGLARTASGRSFKQTRKE